MLLGYLLLFAALYGGYGALSPFLPAFLQERGLSSQEIASFLAAAMLVRLVAGPLAGRLADRTGATRTLLALCLALAGGLTLGFLPWHGFLPLLAIGLVQAVTTAPLAPLADALALAAAQGGRAFEYGWVRAAGSAAFIAATVLTGQFVAIWGSATGLWACCGLFALAALAAMRVATPLETDRSNLSPHPEVPTRSGGLEGGLQDPPSALEGSFEARSRGRLRMRVRMGERGAGAAAEGNGFRELLAIPRFRRLVLAAALVIGAHAMHDAFAIIVWSGAGIASGAAGLLWSESVAAEIAVFLWLGPRLLARIGAPCTLMLCALAGAVRWAVQSQTSWLPALVGIQCLHGLTFAALHLACLALIEESVPERLRATALTVYGTFGLGLASALVTLAAGQLYAVFGPRAFLAMSALSLAAIPLASSLRQDRACTSA